MTAQKGWSLHVWEITHSALFVHFGVLLKIFSTFKSRCKCMLHAVEYWAVSETEAAAWNMCWENVYHLNNTGSSMRTYLCFLASIELENVLMEKNWSTGLVIFCLFSSLLMSVFSLSLLNPATHIFGGPAQLRSSKSSLKFRCIINILWSMFSALLDVVCRSLSVLSFPHFTSGQDSHRSCWCGFPLSQ